MKAATLAASGGRKKYSVYVASRANRVVLGIGIAIVAVFVFFPLFGGTPMTRRLVDFFSLLALAQMWNLMLGYAGLISVGQQGYIGMGAYTLWLFADVLHVHPFVCVIIAGLVGAIIALPSAALVFKLRGGYLAIGTWVLAEVLKTIVANIKQTGGGSGVTVVAARDMAIQTRVYGTYWWALGAALIAIAVTYVLLRSRTGLALKSIRDNDLAAESSGVNLWRTRLYTFVIAGAGCAMVGAISAMHVLFVQPAAAFNINWTAYLVFITVIGGVGTIEGPIIGTIIYFVLRETMSTYGEWYFIVLGLVAIVVTVWSPRGIYGFISQRTNFYLFPLQRKLRLDGGEGGGETPTGGGTKRGGKANGKRAGTASGGAVAEGGRAAG
jgi:branched-chain amino acid transport system permease protein